MAAITWMQSSVTDAFKGVILFKRAQSIQTLLKNPSVGRQELDNQHLHHVYHNLIPHIPRFRVF